MFILKKQLKLLTIFTLLALALVGCSSSNGNYSEERGEIVFADAQWDSIQFHNAVVGTVAEHVFGYTWREVQGSTTVLYEGFLNGEIDAFTEMWTDNLADYEQDREDGKFKDLGSNFNDNYQGFYVPRYVIEGDEERGIEASAPDLKYVWDLKDYPDVFQDDEDKSKGRVYGSIPGWEVDEIMHSKYEHYGLDENFIYFRPGSEAALGAAITSAYERGEPIATYYWEPTWLLGMYDMVLLEDEPYDEDLYLKGETELPAVEVNTVVSNDFAEKDLNQDFIDFFTKYETSSELTSEALAYMQETDADHEETAEWFLREHDDLVSEWLTEDEAETLRDYLAQ